MPRNKSAITFASGLTTLVVLTNVAGNFMDPMDYRDHETFNLMASSLSSSATSSVMLDAGFGQDMVTGEVYEILRPESRNRVHFILTDVSSGS